MKGRSVLRRRRAERGFTLLEMMVVVMLVAILAAIAAPSMGTARNDRLAFDLARQTSELFHNARARAAGRGAAHLALFTTHSSYGGGRGSVFVFEALDGVAAPTGPNPSSSCRSSAQWTDVIAYTPGNPRQTPTMRLIDFLDANNSAANSTQVLEDIRMIAHLTEVAATPAPGPHVPGAQIDAIAVCTTPNGSTFVGMGASPGDAIGAMVSSSDTFKGTFEIDVMRRRSGTPVGLIRRVVLSGAAAPRIKSE